MPNLVDNFEKGIESVPVRAFDRYALGPFLVWFALSSKSMSKWPRRVLLSAGLWQIAYHWRDYRNLPTTIKTFISEAKQGQLPQ